MDENSLPLLSNISNIRARHYLINLQTDIKSQTLSGAVIIFFTQTTACEKVAKFCTDNCRCLLSENTNLNLVEDGCSIITDSFPIILECNDLDIQNIQEIKPSCGDTLDQYLSPKYLRNKYKDFNHWNNKEKESLRYTQDQWSVNIQNKDGLFSRSEFPKIICISYATKAKGESISWRQCDEGKNCFFTCGSFINNRSLFPSQDRPLAMATWQAWITVPPEFYVSMTGDQNPLITDDSNLDMISHSQSTLFNVQKNRCFYYYTSMVLPAATVAIDVGKWTVIDVLSEPEILDYNKNYPGITTKTSLKTLNQKCNHVCYPCHLMRQSDQGPLIPVTVVSSTTLLPKAKELLKFIKFILIATYKLFGKFPFTRLEIVVMPRPFSSLGLASPNVIFLSKSIFINDSSFYLRLAHEISHSWFGITIGPKNWEEEWLSEGFATYLEDSIYALAVEESLLEESAKTSLKMTDVAEKYEDFFNLRGHLRYLTLLSEKQNTDEELQVLSPHDPCSSQEKESVPNGLNSDKAFLQVHYLKGYFLLQMLSSVVSRSAFDEFIGIVVTVFHGQLISSTDFFNLFYDHFPSVIDVIPLSSIVQKWLRNPDINEETQKTYEKISNQNILYKTVEEHKHYWLEFDKLIKVKNSKVKINVLNQFKFIYSDQIVVLFEILLKEDALKVQTLSKIYSFYQIPSRNSDIKHRWCELVIKHNYPQTSDIEDFLIENQAMGVYLYGELVLSGKKKLKKLAVDIFEKLKTELDGKTQDVVSSMVYGS